ncbi:MAG: DUF1501 domain-containing protein [Planctomycetota bacterium]
MAPPNTGGRRFALHPSLAGIHQLFQQGNVAVLSNVGTLVEPTTRDQFRNGLVTVPPQLFGHNTQQEQWQLSRPNVSDGLGWGGRIADVLQANGANADATVSMNISLAGRSRFLAGREVAAYSVGTNGASELDLRGSGNRATAEDAFLDMVAVHQDTSHPASTPMGRVLADVTRRSVDNGRLVNDLLSQGTSITAAAPATRLAQQMEAVAKLIEIGRAGLSHQRQIFFVSLGGFDNHSGLLGNTPTTGPHGASLAEVNGAMMYFWEALGQLGLRDNVTTFTASDFGRTFRSNGNGSDHGWGGHHFVMGGSQVRGGRVYGEFPSIVIGGSQDAGNGGTFVPTTAVDEYGFELARWMGVPASEMRTVFPNIDRFLDPLNPSTHLRMLQLIAVSRGYLVAGIGYACSMDRADWAEVKRHISELSSLTDAERRDAYLRHLADEPREILDAVTQLVEHLDTPEDEVLPVLVSDDEDQTPADAPPQPSELPGVRLIEPV